MQAPHSLLLLVYVVGLPFLWALLVGFDIARKLRPAPFAELKAAGEFALGVLIIPMLQVVLVVVSTKVIEAEGHRVSSEAALRLMSVVSLPFALVAVWSLLSLPIFMLVGHLRRAGGRMFGRRASDRHRALAPAGPHRVVAVNVHR